MKLLFFPHQLFRLYRNVSKVFIPAFWFAQTVELKGGWVILAYVCILFIYLFYVDSNFTVEFFSCLVFRSIISNLFSDRNKSPNSWYLCGHRHCRNCIGTASFRRLFHLDQVVERQ